jgi:hypothetical protein
MGEDAFTHGRESATLPEKPERDTGFEPATSSLGKQPDPVSSRFMK